MHTEMWTCNNYQLLPAQYFYSHLGESSLFYIIEYVWKRFLIFKHGDTVCINSNVNSRFKTMFGSYCESIYWKIKQSSQISP